ncbi:GntR family transcriptional regulator [Azospirillum baldaniorum]|uniref:GntR family transcriptional regulator n=4 Tax=Azospirillum TaxID=191 RepID=A0A235H7I0_AZOBR|nr:MULTISPECIES: GntR family transcriptional regulator [Azospirillum]AIB11854.1 GntR family transcriptional regulator [Azospirillum argentinense]AWJ82951.1 GntR family transcriptional regulator [Azospirillum sp. TSH58]AWJ89938.1 GntR family transcriptional regulator [Azospirillum baldaniorum]EZQ08733.1 GntR family transcriptional regulator [Azospirillum argentinense]KAA1052748.1 Transcriptional regulator, GntR family [Azospirillum argentinense]
MNPPPINVQPLDTGTTFRSQAYHALKQAISQMDIYDHNDEIRLEERQLSELLGVSRTPIREALTLLEQEGFIRLQPRRGIFVIRKTKAEIVEMIQVWAALESMAGRMVATQATDEDIRTLWDLFRNFEMRNPKEHVNEYSDANIAFHKSIIRLSGSKLIQEMTDNLFIHIRAIRKLTIGQDNRAERSINDHKEIIKALERRDVDQAEHLIRDHTLGLAAHVEKHCDFLE